MHLEPVSKTLFIPAHFVDYFLVLSYPSNFNIYVTKFFGKISLTSVFMKKNEVIN